MPAAMPVSLLRSLARWLFRCLLGPLLRGTVRCAMPLVCLLVFALFVWLVPQGREVLLNLAERRAERTLGGNVSGPLWLGFASTALGLSLWYSLRWLLGAAMAGLPLPAQPGGLRRWLPRLAGAAPAALVALGFWGLGDVAAAVELMLGFAALSLLTLLLLAGRGMVLARLATAGWLAQAQGRVLASAGPGRARSLVPAELPQGQVLPWVSRLVVFWGLALSFLLTLLLIRFPVAVPPDIGAAALVALALAAINLFGSFALSFLPLRHGLPHLAPWALLLAGLIGPWTDNHRVQPAVWPEPSSSSAASPPGAPPRQSVRQAFEQHLAARPQAGGGATPVIFIASEGGGIRAAFWTAELLRQLSAGRPELLGETFALSGVSGGSLGLASWLADERQRLCPQPDFQRVAGLIAEPAWQDKDLSPVSARLGGDYLAAPVAGMLFYDLLQRFWPHAIDSFDRSRALEQSWQRAHAHLPGQPMAMPLWTWYAGCERLPHLLLNTTVVETGQRAVLSRLDAALPAAPGQTGPRSVFVNSWQDGGGQDLLGPAYRSAAQSTAGLVHHSARFPALSPAGTVERQGPQGWQPALRLVDGGYYDNSGAQTLVDLIDHLCSVMPSAAHPRPFRPLVLLLRNAPEPFDGATPTTAEPSGLFPELGSIIGGLYRARSAHAVTARMQLRQRLNKDLLDLAVPMGSAAARGALGWTLSGTAQRNYSVEAGKVADFGLAELRRRLADSDSDGCQRSRVPSLPPALAAAVPALSPASFPASDPVNNSTAASAASAAGERP